MKKKLGIHTGNISIGGQEKMLVEFLKILSPEKYEIELYIEEDKGDKNYYEKEIPSYVHYQFLTDKSFMEKLLNLKKSRNPIKKIIYSYMLKKKKSVGIKKINENMEKYHCFIDYDMGLLRNFHKIKRSCPFAGWSHAGKGEILKNRKKRDNVNLYDYIVAINEEMKKGYEKNYTPKVVKIDNFIDIDDIKKKGDEELEEKKLGKYILSVGSLTENKNHKELVVAFKRYVEEYDGDLNLVILGEGKERKSLEEMIKVAELEDRIFLLGNKKNPYPYMKNCELYIQTSKAEAFSLVLAEAMSFGKCVISKKNIGAVYVLNNGEYGVLVETADDIVVKIDRILSDEGLRKEYEKKSYLRSKEFSKERAKEKIEEFIDAI